MLSVPTRLLTPAFPGGDLDGAFFPLAFSDSALAASGGGTMASGGNCWLGQTLGPSREF